MNQRILGCQCEGFYREGSWDVCVRGDNCLRVGGGTCGEGAVSLCTGLVCGWCRSQGRAVCVGMYKPCAFILPRSRALKLSSPPPQLPLMTLVSKAWHPKLCLAGWLVECRAESPASHTEAWAIQSAVQYKTLGKAGPGEGCAPWSMPASSCLASSPALCILPRTAAAGAVALREASCRSREEVGF